MKKILLLVLSLLTTFIIFSQSSEVIATVNWPQWSTENKVEIYDANNNLLQTIDNGYLGSTNNSYNDTVTIGNLSNGSGYYAIVYDLYGDGWNGNGSLNITSDGVNVLSFDGVFDTQAGGNVEETKTISFEVTDPPPLTPGVPVFDTSGNEYIEYIPGNLPIVISAPHGGVKQSGQTIGGVFYPDNDSSLPDRSCGTNERDDNTEILVRRIQDEIFAQTGCYAHVIISNLHRSKLDPNREQNEATCGNSTSLFYWNTFHDFIDQASNSVEANWGKGLFIDLHGQSHTVPRIEIGYRIDRSDINNTTPGHLNTVTGSTITNLVTDNILGYTQEQIVTGENSLGAMFHNAPGTFYAAQNYPGCGRNGENGYRATPSNFDGGSSDCNDRRPNNNNYFSGFYYNNTRHGSGPAASDGEGGGGHIDGVMTEVNRRVRDLGPPFDSNPNTLEPFAIDYANVVLQYIDTHYNNFTSFNYTANAYDVNASDPMPTITGVFSGTFSSSAGLVIDSDTGLIDVSESTIGNYTVTYTAGTCGYYSSTQDIEITDNTLSIEESALTSIKLFPSPTNGNITIKSNGYIKELKLYNMVGQLVKRFNVSSKETTINISSLKDGAYIIRFIANNNTIGSKLILKN